MDLEATGWHRTVDIHYLGEYELCEASETSDAYISKMTYVSTDKSIRLSWHTDARLNGEYRFDMTLSREDVACLLRFLYGEVLDSADMKELGIQLTPDALTELLRRTELGDLVQAGKALLEKQPSDDEEDE